MVNAELKAKSGRKERPSTHTHTHTHSIPNMAVIISVVDCVPQPENGNGNIFQAFNTILYGLKRRARRIEYRNGDDEIESLRLEK